MAAGFLVGCTVAVGCGMAVGAGVAVGCGITVGLQAEFPPQIGPQVAAQSPQVAQDWLQVESLHPLVVQMIPQVVSQAEFVPQNGSNVAAQHQLIVQPMFCAGLSRSLSCGPAAKAMLAVEASIIAAASAVYFLNMLVHLRSITVLLQTVA